MDQPIPPTSTGFQRPTHFNMYRTPASKLPPGTPLLLEPITVPNVKKSRKRRDRKASGIPSQDATITVRHDSNDEETPKRSRPVAVQCMFWFCGILMVILGAGALVYGIVLLFTSMGKIIKNVSPHATHHQKIQRKVSGGTWTVE
ncbi:hypothetical protein Bhyg_08818, partial [Pseudolycoriella hygida]